MSFCPERLSAMSSIRSSRHAVPAHSVSRRLLAVLLLCAPLLAACGPARDGEKPQAATGAPAAPAAVPKLAVVATFTILADLVSNVGGDRVAVTTVVGPDGDAHTFSPTPADAKSIADARLVFVNGLGFEGWIDKLIAASGYQGPVVVVSQGIKAIRATGHGHSHNHKHDHGEFDPHGWQSLVQVQRYVANIADALVAADPQHASGYRMRAADYLQAIRQLHDDARKKFEAIPQADRRVISGHDSFAYLAEEYGLKFYSPRGLSSDSEASAKDVARLSKQIRSQNIQAVFIENISDPRLVEQLARESGVRVGGILFSDALSVRDPRARTYLDMMRHNTDEVAKALARTGPAN